MAGRKTKYTADVTKRIMQALTAGMPRKGASEYGGVDQVTLERWMHKYVDFADAVIAAEASCELRAALTIRQAFVDGDWKAAAFWLSRRRSQTWGETHRVEIINTVREMARAAGQDEDAAVAEAVAILKELRSAGKHA